MEKQNSRKRRSRRKKRNLQNKIAMLCITVVVCAIFIVLMLQGASLRGKIDGYEKEKETISQQIEAENERTEDIEALKEYMESDEYAEETAREKLGLVKENEIIFKEE
ncbi:MAG: FtsB family cell division protein [Lachnospiraceae bacterium]|jgi:cell division protein DivIC